MVILLLYSNSGLDYLRPVSTLRFSYKYRGRVGCEARELQRHLNLGVLGMGVRVSVGERGSREEEGSSGRGRRGGGGGGRARK